MKKLLTNYENRITNFVLKMAHAPIIIKKNSDKYLTTREEFLAKTSKNILDKKGFTFKSYKTDKERVNEIVKHKNDLEKIIPKKKTKSKISQQITMIQPSMRFTARTDLERVLDVLKGRELILKEQKAVQDQLSHLGFVSQNLDEYGDEDKTPHSNDSEKEENKFLSEEERQKKMIHNKIIQDRKNMVKRRNFFLGINNKNKKRVNEIHNVNYARKLREELYKRTHFKAMENLTMFKASTVNHNIFRKWSNEDKIKQKSLSNAKKLFYQSLDSSKNKQNKNYFTTNLAKKRKNYDREIMSYGNLKRVKKINKKNENEVNILKENDILFNSRDIAEEIEAINPLLYNLNFSSVKNDINSANISIEKIQSLQKMAFEEKNSSDESDSKEEKFIMDDLKKEENIEIDGKYYKKSETDKIANALLNKCNWTEKKSKFNQKFGSGKLMFTNGLTLKEFEMKYGLVP